MYAKRCIFCGRESFSACVKKWICPYCGRDITAVTAKPAAAEPRRPGAVPRFAEDKCKDR